MSQQLAELLEQSPLYFHVAERECDWRDKNGKHHPTDKKALIRAGDINYLPRCLAVVNKSWKLVQNYELFPAVDEHVNNFFMEEELRDMQVTDEMAYGGQMCMRTYTLPNLFHHVDANSKAAFRLIVVNSFGRSAIKMYVGAIDFFCMNGMILGSYESSYARHTSGLNLSRIEDRLRNGLEEYEAGSILMRRAAKTDADMNLAEEIFRGAGFSDRNVVKLMDQTAIEFDTRGNNLWAIISALTYYASHNDGDFTVKKSQNDNVPSVMLSRQQHVARIVSQPNLLKYVDIAA